MNAKQTNRLASYTATESLLKAAPEVVGVAGFPAMLATLSAKTGEINRLAKDQTQPLQVRTTERDLILEAMTELTLEVAGFVRAVAREAALPQLALSVQVGLGSFRRARHSHRMWFAQRVLDAAQTVLPQLGAYGVTAATLADLQARILEATQRVNLPRETVAAKRAATLRLVVLLDEVETLLDDGIDPMVFPLRKIHPEFYATYEATRLVVDVPHARESEEEDEEEVVPLPVPAPVTPLNPLSGPIAA